MAGIITDATAITFCDQTIRPVADRMVQLYYFAKSAQHQWTAKGLAALVPNDNTQVVQDGSVVGKDGRTPATGFDVNAVMSWLGAFVTAMEASTNTELNQVGKIAVNIHP